MSTTDEIIKLTPKAINQLIRSRHADSEPHPGHERRRAPRWPFPGTVEIHPADGHQEPCFATCRNISETGLGMSSDRYFELETVLDIAIHLPEATLCGRGVVRYCQQTPSGFMTGIEFMFQ